MLHTVTVGAICRFFIPERTKKKDCKRRRLSVLRDGHKFIDPRFRKVKLGKFAHREMGENWRYQKSWKPIMY